MAETEILVTYRDGKRATLTGTGTSIFKLAFVAKGDAEATARLKQMFNEHQSGYTAYDNGWGGKIGGSLSRLVNVLTQEATQTPGRHAQLTWSFLREPAPEDLPPVEPGDVEARAKKTAEDPPPAPDHTSRALDVLAQAVETLGRVATVAATPAPTPPAPEKTKEPPKLLRTEKTLMRDETGRPVGAVETLVYEEEGGEPC
jgi:hypothetical protein